MTGDFADEVQRTVTFFRAQLAMPDLLPRLYRMLAQGEPVSVRDAADAGGWPEEEVAAELARHPGVDWADDGRIEGLNLTLRRTPYAFTFDGRTVYAFCASGALEFPIVLGRPGVITSRCPVTQEPVRVEVTPERVVGVTPSTAVISKVKPQETVADVRADVCDLGQMFRSPADAAGWLRRYPHGEIAAVAEEFEIYRQTLLELGWTAHQEAQR